eukprot:5000085-Ditylum_brightwellii.AAC.1
MEHSRSHRIQHYAKPWLTSKAHKGDVEVVSQSHTEAYMCELDAHLRGPLPRVSLKCYNKISKQQNQERFVSIKECIKAFLQGYAKSIVLPVPWDPAFPCHAIRQLTILD